MASLHPRALSGQILSLRALAGALAATGDEVRLRSVARSEAGPGPAAGLLGYLASVLGLLRTLARESGDADLVHLNLPTPGFSLLADWLASRLPAPLVVGYEAPLIGGDLVGSVARSAGRGPGFYLPRLLVNNPIVAGVARHRAGAYVVSSRYQETQLSRLGVGRPVEVIPNLVEVAEVAPDPARARRTLGLPDGTPLVGYLGHLHPVKGVETLVRAFARLIDRLPEVRLVLAWSGLGDPSGVSGLLDRLGCRERVIWLGQTSLSHLLRALDVLALPYRHPIGQNAFPNVLLEAQSLGVPLVTTEIPVVDEVCSDGETALLVPPDEPALLADALEQLLGNPGSREAMARRQRHRFAGSFAPAALVERYRALYRRVLDGGTEASLGQGGRR